MRALVIFWRLLPFVVAVVGALIYFAQRNVYLLAASTLASTVFFLIIFVIPPHVLPNPFRGYRQWR